MAIRADLMSRGGGDCLRALNPNQIGCWIILFPLPFPSTSPTLQLAVMPLIGQERVVFWREQAASYYNPVRVGEGGAGCLVLQTGDMPPSSLLSSSLPRPFVPLYSGPMASSSP